jgi:hypothetical protein
LVSVIVAPRVRATPRSASIHGLRTGIEPETVTTAVEELFAGFGSLVAELTVAVLETGPAASGAVTLIVIGFAAPTASDGNVHVTTLTT